MINKQVVQTGPLDQLKQFTAARIGLGHIGTSIPVKHLLEFKLAHAHARDAVYSTMDSEGLFKSIMEFNLPILLLHSKASTRHKYLKRPDWGRKLDEGSDKQLKDYQIGYDVAIIIADGLSAEAINQNACRLLKILVPMFVTSKIKIAPICLVEQGRVAIGDDISYGLKAKFSIVLIGERPGLSAADSMGAYLTYNPKPGLTDEARNCVSNIREQGLSYKHAAEKIYYLTVEAFKRKLSGVELKDDLIFGAISD